MRSLRVQIIFLGLTLSILLAAPAHGGGIAITGQVLDVKGKPVPGARLELLPQIGTALAAKLAAEGRDLPEPIAKAASDAQGRYALTAPEAGMWQVVVRAPGSVPQAFPLTPLLEPIDLPAVKLVPDARSEPIDPESMEWAALKKDEATGPPQAERVSRTGRVLAAGTRKPIAGAFVWLRGAAGDFVRTNEQGAYTLAGPAGRFGTLRAAADGYVEATEALRSPTTGPAFVLRPAAWVGGTVVDGQGKPVAAGIRTVGLSIGSGEAYRELRVPRSTDQQGAFRFRLTPGMPYELEASSPGFAPTRFALGALAPQEKRNGIRIVLERGRSASGQLLGLDGKPLAGVEVWLSQIAEHSLALLGQPEIQHQVLSDAQGRFRFTHLPPGQFSLQVWAKGFAPEVGAAFQMTGSADVDLGRIVLEPGVLLEGRVVDSRERTVEGAEVHASRSYGVPYRSEEAGDNPYRATTGADGRFTFPDLKSGETVRLGAVKKGSVQRKILEVTVPAEEPVTLVLEPGLRLTGRVVDSQGLRVADASLYLFRTEGSGEFWNGDQGLGQSDREGRFTLEGLAPGNHTLQVFAPGYLDSSQPVQIAAGRDLEGVEIIMDRAAVLSGRVLGPDGAPVAGARVGLAQSLLQVMTSHVLTPDDDAVTDGDGHYRLEKVPPGPQAVTATHSEYRRALGNLDVLPGENRLDLQMDRGLEISGWVLDGDGQPVAQEMVTLTGVGGRIQLEFQQTLSGADGSFRFSGIAGGVYDVQAGMTAAYSALQIRVIDGHVSGLELRLKAGEQEPEE